jgi:large subunit ribosomal protein L25
MQDLVLNATTRTDRGSAACRRMRHKGMLPGVMYGHGQQRSIALNYHDFTQMLHKLHAEHAVVKCKVDRDDLDVLIKDVQRNCVSHDIEHVDFLIVDLDEIVNVAVPLEVHGEADGVKNHGGVLELLRREVAVACKARDIPVSIRVDVSALKIHDLLLVGALPVLPGITYVLSAETPLITVAAPTLHEEAAPDAAAAEGAPAEPEVITAKKPAEEGAEEAAKKKE